MAAFTGAISSLTIAENWRQTNDTDMTPDEIAAVFSDIFELFWTGAYDPVYPTTATFWHDAAHIIAGNGIATQHDTQQNYATYSRQLPAAINDEFLHEVFLDEGEYTLFFLIVRANNQAIGSFYFDETLVGTSDFYSSSTAYNIVISFAVSSSFAGVHRIRGVAASKNASSSEYRLTITKGWIR